MADGLLGIMPSFQHRIETPLPPPPAATVPAQPLPSFGAEHQQIVDAVFAQDRDSAAVAGMLGAWGCSILLCDLAQEHFHIPAEELDEPCGKPDESPEEE